MKHASPATLDELETLLATLRGISGLTERKRGIFYRRGHASLHFHDDPAGIFADLRDQADWRRYPLNTEAQRQDFMRMVRSRP